MSTRTDKVVTRSMTKKKADNISQTGYFIECHRRDGVTPITWSPVFHNEKCLEMYSSDDDEYQEPCKCCMALLFRKEGQTNQYNIACRTCFNWKGPIPYSRECA
jgi:hypothetical protein